MSRITIPIILMGALLQSACGRPHLSADFGRMSRALFTAQAEKRPRSGRAVALFTAKDASRAIQRDQGEKQGGASRGKRTFRGEGGDEAGLIPEVAEFGE